MSAWLRGVVESAGGGAEREEWRHGDLGAYAEAAPAWRFDLIDGPWLTVDEAREAAALHNVAPELLACVDELAAVRDEALATLAHYRARATGGQIVREPRMSVSTAIAIERDTRSVNALRAKVRACMEASHG